MFVEVLFATLGLLLLITILPNRAIGTSRRDDLAGPKGHKIFGNALEIGRNVHRALDYFHENARKYGPCSTITLPFVRMIDVSDPACLEHIQGPAFLKYEKGDWFRGIFKDILGQGLFVVDGHEWIFQRKRAVHLFSNKAYKGPITQSIHHALDRLTQNIDTAGEESPIELSKLIYTFTTDVFCSIAFGDSLASKGGVSRQQFGQIVDEGQAVLDNRLHNPLWKITEAITGKRRQVRTLGEQVDQYIYAFMDEPQARDAQNLMGSYLRMSDEKGQPLQRSFIRDSLVNIIVAGRDPCACALNWAMYHIIANPDLVKTIREEIEEVLEDDPVTYSNYTQLKFCTALVWETLRLHPSIPKNILCAMQDDVLPNAVVIQKGDYVRFSDWQMARNPDIWDDCLAFKPSRWFNESGGLSRPSPYIFHAFNSGPRACVGQTLAIFESIAVFVSLLRKYDFSFDKTYLATLKRDEDGLYPKYKASLTHPLAQPLLVKARVKSV